MRQVDMPWRRTTHVGAWGGNGCTADIGTICHTRAWGFDYNGNYLICVSETEEPCRQSVYCLRGSPSGVCSGASACEPAIYPCGWLVITDTSGYVLSIVGVCS